MIDKKHIEELTNAFLEDSDRFLVELNINTDNRILVFIDSDTQVTIDHCIALSRHLESSLDREKEDFELSVSSSGVGQPFTQLRQYHKYYGKPIQIKLNDGTTRKGILKSVDNTTMEFFDQAANKNKKSKKIVAGELLTLPMSNITEAKGIVIF